MPIWEHCDNGSDSNNELLKRQQTLRIFGPRLAISQGKCVWSLSGTIRQYKTELNIHVASYCIYAQTTICIALPLFICYIYIIFHCSALQYCVFFFCGYLCPSGIHLRLRQSKFGWGAAGWPNLFQRKRPQWHSDVDISQHVPNNGPPRLQCSWLFNSEIRI